MYALARPVWLHYSQQQQQQQPEDELTHTRTRTATGRHSDMHTDGAQHTDIDRPPRPTRGASRGRNSQRTRPTTSGQGSHWRIDSRCGVCARVHDERCVRMVAWVGREYRTLGDKYYSEFTFKCLLLVKRSMEEVRMDR